MDDLWKITTLFILFCVVNCQGKVYKSSSGDIVSSGDSDSNKIMVGKGRKIVIEISEVTAEDRSFQLKVEDGKLGSTYTYTKIGSRVYQEDSEGRQFPVSLPIRIETEYRKLWIRKTGRGGYVAHYTSYSASPTSCTKEDIANTFSNELSITCNTGDLSPVASQCDVTLQCPDLYRQYKKSLSCVNGHWEGLIQCQPKANLVKKCSYDFDANTESRTCPYTSAEVAHYYIEVEGVDGFEPGLGRTQSRRINCHRTCAHDRNGKRIVNCGNKNDKRQYMLCLICRIMYNCMNNVVVF